MNARADAAMSRLTETRDADIAGRFVGASDLPRHTLVWLEPGSPWTALPGSPVESIDAWFRERRPAVVARRQGDEPPGCMRLGIALPPAQGKQRLTLMALASDIGRTRGPLSLSEVIASSSCPDDWSFPLWSLRMGASDIGLAAGVYGSFAWQALTGERYVASSSDIDLLWQPRNRTQVDALLALLMRWEKHTRRRADGEVILPNGDAVCWRELAGNSERILVKSDSTVTLRSRAQVLAEFA